MLAPAMRRRSDATYAEALGRVKAALAALAAHAALTRPARSRLPAIIGATRNIPRHGFVVSGLN